MTPDNRTTPTQQTRLRQETFAVIICNLSLLTVILNPAGGLPASARIGFALGLLLLDTVYAIMRIRFRGNPAALKKNRSYRTIYYFSWGMIGLAIVLVIMNSLGFFRRGPVFSLCTAAPETKAVQEIWGDTAWNPENACATQMKTLENSGELRAILDAASVDAEETKTNEERYGDEYFADNLLGCVCLSTGKQSGRIAADSSVTETDSGRELGIRIYFAPQQEETDVRTYLLFAQIPRTCRGEYDAVRVELISS